MMEDITNIPKAHKKQKSKELQAGKENAPFEDMEIIDQPSLFVFDMGINSVINEVCFVISKTVCFVICTFIFNVLLRS